MNSDDRRGRSRRFFSVKGVGCNEQKKSRTVVWGSTPQEGQRGYGIVLSSHDRNGGIYRRMNEVGKG